MIERARSKPAATPSGSDGLTHRTGAARRASRARARGASESRLQCRLRPSRAYYVTPHRLHLSPLPKMFRLTTILGVRAVFFARSCALATMREGVLRVLPNSAFLRVLSSFLGHLGCGLPVRLQPARQHDAGGCHELLRLCDDADVHGARRGGWGEGAAPLAATARATGATACRATCRQPRTFAACRRPATRCQASNFVATIDNDAPAPVRCRLRARS